jgi:hypothetical protein
MVYFNNLRPNFVHRTIFLKLYLEQLVYKCLPRHWNCLLLFLWYLELFWLGCSFSVVTSAHGLIMLSAFTMSVSTSPTVIPPVQSQQGAQGA